MDLNLKGTTALVTGGTAGIGLAIVDQLLEEGSEVIVPGRNLEKLRALQSKFAADATVSQRLKTITADVTTVEGAYDVFRKYPAIDILINNLGIYEFRDFLDTTDEAWRLYFEVNVLSGVRLSRFYLPHMLQQNWGRMIFISSDSSMIIPPDMIHYAMTKTAQLAVSRGLSELTKGTNVTVNSVLAGTTRSEGINDFLKSVASDPEAQTSLLEAIFFC